jgi:hypothetical protein
MALFIPLVALYTAGAAWLAWWMLEPINRVAGHLQLSTRFVLTDLLGLMVLLQLPLASAGRAIETGGDRDSSPYWLLVGAGVFLVMVLWAAAVSVVSRAGITRLWQRLCVIVLLVPTTLFVMVACPATIVWFVVGSVTIFSHDGMPLAFAGMLLLALVVAAFAIRWLAFWALRDSPGEAALAAIMAGRLPQPATTMLAPSPPGHLPANRQP